MSKNSNQNYVSKDEVNEMIESALRRHNRRSTIISSVLGWILIGVTLLVCFRQFKTFNLKIIKRARC